MSKLFVYPMDLNLAYYNVFSNFKYYDYTVTENYIIWYNSKLEKLAHYNKKEQLLYTYKEIKLCK